jgi:hypothetical protein
MFDDGVLDAISTRLRGVMFFTHLQANLFVVSGKGYRHQPDQVSGLTRIACGVS